MSYGSFGKVLWVDLTNDSFEGEELPENGYPLKETLKDLDLEFVIKDLY